ncbi:hypothetical protein C922_05078, partial [Plasmodium inui San Antonio 1]
MSIPRTGSQWELTSCDRRKHQTWGYPRNQGSGNSCNSTTRYCFTKLTESGSSRWDDLDNWISRTLLKDSRYRWNHGFDPNQTTKLLTLENKKEMTWGQFLDKILEKVDSQVLSGNLHLDSLTWTRQEWASALKSEIPLRAPLDKLSSGSNLLFVILCIVTGLIEGKNNQSKLFIDRGTGCYPVDAGLEFTVDEWKQWITNKEGRKRRRDSLCSSVGGTDGCQEASIALILSIYEALKAICPECGPYRLSYWIKEKQEKVESEQDEYCYFEGEQENCRDSLQDKSHSPVLITREGKFRVLDRPEVHKVAEVLKSAQEAAESIHEDLVLLRENSTDSIDKEGSGEKSQENKASCEGKYSREVHESSLPPDNLTDSGLKDQQEGIIEEKKRAEHRGEDELKDSVTTPGLGGGVLRRNSAEDESAINSPERAPSEASSGKEVTAASLGEFLWS